MPSPALYYQKPPFVVHRVVFLFIPTSNSTVQSHNRSNSTVDSFGAFLFVGLYVTSRVGFDVDIVHHPAQDRVPAVCYFLLHRLNLTFFARDPTPVSGVKSGRDLDPPTL